MLNKSVLVTGCDSGIGLELCRQLPRRGYFVIAGCKSESGVKKVQNVFSNISLNISNDNNTNLPKCVSNEVSLEEEEKENDITDQTGSNRLQDKEGDSNYFKNVGSVHLMDVTDDDSVLRVVKEILRETKKNNIPDLFALVNNAGIWRFSLLEESSLSYKNVTKEINTWKEVLETNLLGYLRTTLHLYPLLKKSTHKKPRIIFVSSVLDYGFFPGQSSYMTSKRAIRSLHECLLMEFLSKKVKFVCISPGPMSDTALSENLIPSDDDKEYLLKETLDLKNSLRELRKIGGTRFRAVNVIIKALDSKNPKKRYSNITGTFLFRLLTLLPQSLVLPFVKTFAFNYWWVQGRFPLFGKILKAIS